MLWHQTQTVSERKSNSSGFEHTWGSQLIQRDRRQAHGPLVGKHPWTWVTTIAIASGLSLTSSLALADTIPQPTDQSPVRQGAHNSLRHKIVRMVDPTNGAGRPLLLSDPARPPPPPGPQGPQRPRGPPGPSSPPGPTG